MSSLYALLAVKYGTDRALQMILTKYAADYPMLILKTMQDMESNVLTAAMRTLLKDEDIDNWNIAKSSQANRLREEMFEVALKELPHLEVTIKEFTSYEAAKELQRNMTALKKATGQDFGIGTQVVDMKLQQLERELNLYLKKTTFEMVNNTGIEYKKAISDTMREVFKKEINHREAAAKVGVDWARKGVTALKDKAGRNWTIEGYTNMVVRQTAKQIGTQMQESLFNEHDIDLIEYSSHMDSRPSHEPFQGRIYSRSGNSKKYDNIDETGYGEPDGMVTGFGCRHEMYPYIEGVSIQRYFPHDTEEVAKNYEERQQQRSIERSIRREKRAYQTLKDSTGNKDILQEQKKRIKDQEKRMQGFLKETGLKRRKQNEEII